MEKVVVGVVVVSGAVTPCGVVGGAAVCGLASRAGARMAECFLGGPAASRRGLLAPPDWPVGGGSFGGVPAAVCWAGSSLRRFAGLLAWPAFARAAKTRGRAE